MSHLSSSRHQPILCYVTDRHILSGIEPAHALEALLRTISSAVAAGIGWIQIREKDLSGRDCASLTREALKCAASSARGANRPCIFVNDRLDVALAERAGGVHLGEKSLAVQEAKRLVDPRGRGEDFLIGVSTHSLEEAKSAARDGAHYVFFGPVFSTPSKASYGPPQGLERLAEVCRVVNIPVLAIGGITPEGALSCFSAGAAGIAAIRLFQDAPNVKSVIQAMRNRALD